MSEDYLGEFEKTLRKAQETCQGLFLAMAGHQPVLVAKVNGGTGLAFPPDSTVRPLSAVRDMLQSGHYSIGRRYMEKILEVFDEC